MGKVCVRYTQAGEAERRDQAEDRKPGNAPKTRLLRSECALKTIKGENHALNGEASSSHCTYPTYLTLVLHVLLSVDISPLEMRLLYRISYRTLTTEPLAQTLAASANSLLALQHHEQPVMS